MAPQSDMPQTDRGATRNWLTHDEMIERLATLINYNRNVSALARELKLSRQYTSQILRGERPPPAFVLRRVGLEVRTTYHPIEGKENDL